MPHENAGAVIQNGHLRVEARSAGNFVVMDLASGRTFGPMGHLEDGGDAGDLYNWSPPREDTILRSDEGAGFEIEVSQDRFEARLRVSGAWLLPAALAPDGRSRSTEQAQLRFATTAILTPFSRHVTFETEIENVARDHRLRVLFETGRRTELHHADNAFAVLPRTQRRYDPREFKIEVPAAVAPMHRFVTVEDDEAGATILADGLPEYELKHGGGGVLALTLLRCVGELSRGDLIMRPGGYSGWLNATPEAQCQGNHLFRYAFLPHGPNWPDHIERIHRAAEALLHPIRPRAGRLDGVQADRSFLETSPPSLVLSALKVAEDGEGYVLRIYNPTPKAVEGRVRVGLQIEAVRRAGLEEAAGDSVSADGGVWRDRWEPYRILTSRLYPSGR
jgi:alpha-mannosidase